MIEQLLTPLTHPHEAWWGALTPVAGSLALLLLLTLCGAPLAQPLAAWALQRMRRRHGAVDPTLVYLPTIVTPAQLLSIMFACGAAGTLLLWSLGVAWLALLFVPASVVAGVAVTLQLTEHHYRQRLDAALVNNISRLHGQLASGQSISVALSRLVAELPPGTPLHSEWHWLLEHMGAPRTDGRFATTAEVARALALQTPSLRHRLVLEHLAAALAQPHDALVKRLGAAAFALADAERRQSQGRTALAQLRYSGWVVGGASLAMTIYLAIVQHERVVTAYSGSRGLVAGLVVGSCLVAPWIGAAVLGQAPEDDY